MRRHGRSILAVLSIFALASACASTSDKEVRSATAQSPGDSEPGTTAHPKDGATSRSDTTGSGSAVVPGAPGAPSGPAGVTSDLGAPSQGVTKDTIAIGVELYQGFNAAAAAVGVSGAGGVPGDTTPESVRPTINYINSHGGLGGRKVVPVYHTTDIYQGTYDAHAQAACAAWTEDHKVFATVNSQGWDRETLVSCLAKRNTIALRGGVIHYDQTFADKYRDYFYQPGYLFGDRWKVYLDGVAAQGFFPKTARVGILYQQAPEATRTLKNVIQPWLKAKGITVARTLGFPPYRSTSEGIGGLGSFSNHVLRFRQAQVDRVVFVEGSVTSPFGFMTAAESQSYRPKYALNSAYNLDFLLSSAPKAQLEGSKGVDWWGLPGNGLENSATKLCDQIKGQYCAEFLFLKAVLDRAEVANPAGFKKAVSSLGTSFVSAATFGTRFTPSRYQDGVGVYRPFAFDSACGCFKHTGPGRPIP